MDTKRAIDKITKLLALSASDNPSEASNALLMARKLMAQYKLSEKDLEINKPCKLNEVSYEDLTYSNLRNMWMPTLATVIANNHCCGCVANHGKTSKVNTIAFVGLDDDPTMAKVIFDYAVQHIRGKESAVRKDMYHSHRYSEQYINAYVKQYITNYGAGFSLGLKQKYMEQNAESTDETALVLVKPKEVTDYLSGLSASKLKFKAQQSDAFAKQAGYEAGYSFDPTRQINQAQREERRVLNGSRG